MLLDCKGGKHKSINECMKIQKQRKKLNKEKFQGTKGIKRTNK